MNNHTRLPSHLWIPLSTRRHRLVSRITNLRDEDATDRSICWGAKRWEGKKPRTPEDKGVVRSGSTSLARHACLGTTISCQSDSFWFIARTTQRTIPVDISLQIDANCYLHFIALYNTAGYEQYQRLLYMDELPGLERYCGALVKEDLRC